ncbi:site-specific integrase [Burkholderia metallica]|uniref:Site-specific integrase n=1 Tax=Burkholderia metallica TaxID=488729 RepID=A0ABT8PAA8_9BURK|nr:site-specific integrase [Burkholderia metallica]MDN7932038.1 site-specific integrase [Burkholderia metallica]
MTNHLLRRGSRYYIRRKVPADLQDHYQRKEIVKALGTDKPADARVLVRKESSRLDEEFAAVRAARTAPPDPLVLSPGDMEASRYHDETRRALGLEPRPFLETLFNETGRRQSKQAEFNRQVAVQEEALRRVFGAIAPLTGLPAAAPPNTIHPAKARTPSGPSDGHLAALVEKWAKERKPTGGAVEQMNLAVDRFYTHVGRIPVAAITRQHLVSLKDKLFATDLAASSVKRYMDQFYTLLRFAYDNEVIPALIPRVSVSVKRTEKARISFDTSALNAIFSNPVYAQGERPVRGAGEAAYWIPLLGLYTGARVEELCQLAPDDVYEEAGHWCVQFVYNAERGQRVKNLGSIRRIPLHADLIRLGFVEYVQARKGSPRLFDLAVDRHGKASSSWVKWFGTYLRSVCGVTNPRMTFHSFRHTFKDACRAAGVRREVSDALTGHSDGSASSGYGGDFYPLPPLVDAMARIEIAGVRLAKGVSGVA